MKPRSGQSLPKRNLTPYGFGNERAESEVNLIPKSGEYEWGAKDSDSYWQRTKHLVYSSINMLRKRRLTTDFEGSPLGASITPMHKDNIRRLKNAYKHPF